MMHAGADNTPHHTTHTGCRAAELRGRCEEGGRRITDRCCMDAE